MTTPATFSVTTSKGVSVVHLPDELLSPLDVAQFREEWFVWLDETQPGNVVVDFDLVRAFGSEAVGTLIRVVKRIRSAGGDLKLCSMGDRIREIFDICNLVPTVFEVYPSAGDAVRAFHGRN
jgi:anti-sigma B factor antagonist